MNVLFEKSFLKDIHRIRTPNAAARIRSIIDNLQSATSLSEVAGIKKLSGHGTAYSIRIGDFRIGLFFEKDVVILSRCLNRRDIYKLFPPG
jgi:mRNA interferase RelE/StbE